MRRVWASGRLLCLRRAWCLCLLGLAALSLAGQLWAKAAEAPVRVLLVELQGPVTPAQVDLLEEALARCVEEERQILLIRLDTPGGLVDSMRVMVKDILNAPVPVLIWVGPSGAHAASAGVFLVAASNLAAMAPQTTIGAASPVDIQGQDTQETMGRKIKSDLMGLLRGVAKERGRNLEWYERSVEEAVSATAQEAVLERVVEFVALDPMDFLEQAGARGISHQGTVLRFFPDEVRLETHEPGLRYRFLSWLLHPQIAYLLLLGGMAGLFFEINTPGAVFPGVLGGLCLLLGLYALSVLPTNAAGILLLLFSLVLFLLEIKIVSHGLLSVAAVVAMFIGSMLLVKPGQGFSRIPLGMVVTTVGGVSVLVGTCLYYVGRSLRRPPATGVEHMVGSVAEVRSWQERSGLVFADGAVWSARSAEPRPLEKGQRVRILRVQGLTLDVEPLPEPSASAENP